jgi:hypothetical protein
MDTRRGVTRLGQEMVHKSRGTDGVAENDNATSAKVSVLLALSKQGDELR